VGTLETVVAGQASPVSIVTRTIPDAGSGLIVEVESDFTDQPSTRIALDRFKRPRHEYVTPAGGSEVEVARNDYYDVVPPRESRSARPAV
jgi:hypothetical protein